MPLFWLVITSITVVALCHLHGRSGHVNDQRFLDVLVLVGGVGRCISGEVVKVKAALACVVVPPVYANDQAPGEKPVAPS